MSQEEILEVLANRKLSRREIQEFTELAQQAISYSLKQLLKYNEIIIEISSNRVPIYSVKKPKKKKSGGGFPSHQNK